MSTVPLAKYLTLSLFDCALLASLDLDGNKTLSSGHEFVLNKPSLPSQVAKERLAVFKPTKLTPPTSEDLDNIDYLSYLLAEREQILFKQLGGKFFDLTTLY